MKVFDVQTINSWEPCYPPTKYLPEDWSGTVLDILDHKEIPFQDKLWVICRTDLVSNKLMRLFAVWCARQVQHLMTHKRCIDALGVAEKFARGEATKEQLFDAWDKAFEATWSGELNAANIAAYLSAGHDDELAAKYAAYQSASALKDRSQYTQRSKLREMILAGIKTGDVF